MRATLKPVLQWVDARATPADVPEDRLDKIDGLRAIPFLLLHAACLGVFWVGFSWVAVAVAAALYLARMFFVTAFYHRYFSHRAFQTSRMFQFLMAVAGCTAGQRGPLWWAAHHRHHHATSDRDDDLHSPRRGFWWSHSGWFLTPRSFPVQDRYVRDFANAPEVALVDRFDWVPLVFLACATYGLGALLAAVAPGLGTNGPQMLVWGFFVSTVVLYHATYTINSIAHLYGSRRFATRDDSRNNFWLAILTLGEGWHNNHHHYPASARQGFYWWEIDLTYYGLRLLSGIGLIGNLRPVPAHALTLRREARP